MNLGPEIKAERIKNMEDWIKTWEELWPTLKSQYFMLETLQEYSEVDNPAYVSFLEGDFDKSKELMAKSIGNYKESYNSLFKKGADFIRVHIVKMPLSSYLKDFELQSYKISTTYGERILIADIKEIGEDVNNISDFLLFNGKIAMVHDYDDKGLLIGGWLVKDKGYCKKLKELSQKLISKSVPLGTFLQEKGI